MKRLLKTVYYSFSLFAVLAVVLPIVLVAVAYVALRLPSVQDSLRRTAEEQLSEMLHTRVRIGEVDIRPFSEVLLNDVNVADQQGDTMLYVATLGAGMSMADLLIDSRLVFTYGEIIGMQAHIRRAAPDSATNIQFLIDAFKPKPNKPPTAFDVAVRNIVLRQSVVTYDVDSRVHLPEGQFDANHIRVEDLRADINLPRLKNNDFDIEIKHLSLRERSGLSVSDFSAHALIAWQSLSINGLNLELPHSRIAIEPITLQYDSLPALGRQLPTLPIAVATRRGTVVNPIDLAPFYRPLSSFNRDISLDLKVNAQAGDLNISRLRLACGNALHLDLAATASNITDVVRRKVDVPSLEFRCDAHTATAIAGIIPGISNHVHEVLQRCGTSELDAKISLVGHRLSAAGTIAAAIGRLAGDVTVDLPDQKRIPLHIAGTVATENLALGLLTNRHDLFGLLAMNAEGDLTIRGRAIDGMLNADVKYVEFRARRYDNIRAQLTAEGTTIGGTVTVDDDDLAMRLMGEATLDGEDSHMDAQIDVDRLCPAYFGARGKFADNTLKFAIYASFLGNRLDNATGLINVENFVMTEPGGNEFRLNHLELNADNDTNEQRLTLSSDYLSGKVEGSFDFRTLVPAVKRMLSQSMPSLFGYSPLNPTTVIRPNCFDFSFELLAAESWQKWLKVPIRLIDRANISGHIDELSNSLHVNVQAPYLLNGNKIIEGTAVYADLDSVTRQIRVRAQSIVPTKESRLSVVADLSGVDSVTDAHVAWRLLRERDFHGDLRLCGRLNRNADNQLTADVDINPSQLVFNDTLWQVKPGHLAYDGESVTIDSIAGFCDKQFITINGRASRNPDDQICLELNDISLDYVFETLAINHVNFGGRATGKFYASDLFSGIPRLSTPGLHVNALRYNDALMGDADIRSAWLNDRKAVSLYADISQANNHHSIIDGAIFVADDSLYLDFNCKRANVSFLKPYMAAFTSDVSGEVSGHAVLSGKFQTINLAGNVIADSLRFKLDYTNVYYTCAGDSVAIVPDLITIRGVRIHDRDGHSALFSGWLSHNSFHDPTFHFEVTDASDLLCYDTDANSNPRWYGTIYGNGAAFVDGAPGYVDIRVNMESAPRSRFTFVLSDAAQASESTFLTFTDRNYTPEVIAAEQAAAQRAADTIPEIVRKLRQRIKEQEQSLPTHYTIDLQGDITPDAQLLLVMDPISGDQIKATGSGNMRLTYNDNDEMGMFGTYTIEKGNYTFTLQDIIIKEFSIADGSKITFNGDPYAAEMDIQALYTLTANLADLDETFTTDRDITRTNVPVQALLRASGLINQPDINFDLQFPTLTADIDRKVKSIISTEDMMNRQIIYLLALNRFYTPEYTGATARNNELSSVASSTISSQLSNMLGKVSDNWTIAPNFRTDRGDFSDVEVNLALSSQLLNNRLLLNGNFGYRDNAFNTAGTKFIGDFDIEYLLTPRGNIRLKAYNHFNDQNYYVRNALTTQGLGVVWKHDFDRKVKHRADSPALTTSNAPDSTDVQPPTLLTAPLTKTVEKASPQ